MNTFGISKFNKTITQIQTKAPTTGDYAEKGALWYNYVAGKIYIYDGAIWTEILNGSSKNVNVAVVNPSGNDDSSLGFVIGSQWFNSVNIRTFTATDVSIGAAVWVDDNNNNTYDGIYTIKQAGVPVFSIDKEVNETRVETLKTRTLTGGLFYPVCAGSSSGLLSRLVNISSSQSVGSLLYYPNTASGQYYKNANLATTLNGGIKYNSFSGNEFTDTASGTPTCYMAVFDDSDNTLKKMTNTFDSSVGTPLMLAANGEIVKNSSSIRKKIIIDDFIMSSSDVAKFLNLPLKTYNYINESEDIKVNDNIFMVSNIAEDIHRSGLDYLINYEWVSDKHLTQQLLNANIDKDSYLTEFCVEEKVFIESVTKYKNTIKYNEDNEAFSESEPVEYKKNTLKYFLPGSIKQTNMINVQNYIIREQNRKINELYTKIENINVNLTNLYNLIINEN